MTVTDIRRAPTEYRRDDRPDPADALTVGAVLLPAGPGLSIDRDGETFALLAVRDALAFAEQIRRVARTFPATDLYGRVRRVSGDHPCRWCGGTRNETGLIVHLDDCQVQGRLRKGVTPERLPRPTCTLCRGPRGADGLIVHDPDCSVARRMERQRRVDDAIVWHEARRGPSGSAWTRISPAVAAPMSPRPNRRPSSNAAEHRSARRSSTDFSSIRRPPARINERAVRTRPDVAA